MAPSPSRLKAVSELLLRRIELGNGTETSRRQCGGSCSCKCHVELGSGNAQKDLDETGAERGGRGSAASELGKGAARRLRRRAKLTVCVCVYYRPGLDLRRTSDLAGSRL
uniref:Uncharacterized protein n=1 Tax=Oryza nivara TaxID=4536 RepID=A0A0E0GUF6_ORYNI